MNNHAEYKTDYDSAMSKLAYADSWTKECYLTITEVKAIVHHIYKFEYEKRELEERLKEFQASNQTTNETVIFPENANYK